MLPVPVPERIPRAGRITRRPGLGLLEDEAREVPEDGPHRDAVGRRRAVTPVRVDDGGLVQAGLVVLG